VKDIKSKVKRFLSIFLMPVLKLFYNNKLLYIILRLDPKIINRNSKYFLTMHLRPNRDFQIEEVSKDFSHIGIIIQGPIEYKEDFTLNTIKLYKKMYRNAQIVLSTWDTENQQYLEKIYKENIKVILNRYPENSGILNSNYQITTTKSAVEYLLDKSKYILKTRSDSRIYNQHTLSFFQNLLDIFPNDSKYNQNHRIIGLDINTPKYIPFSFSDILQFGHTDDIYKMWNIDLCKVNISYDKYMSERPIVKDLYFNNNPEILLTLEYLKTLGFDTQNSYESYYESLSKFFIVVDKEMINYYWFKYSIDEFYWNYKYTTKNLQEKVRFSDWLNYYHNYPQVDFNYSYFNKNL
jgi:hypothetical protein